jgi:hypothetical protein
MTREGFTFYRRSRSEPGPRMSRPAAEHDATRGVRVDFDPGRVLPRNHGELLRRQMRGSSPCERR